MTREKSQSSYVVLFELMFVLLLKSVYFKNTLVFQKMCHAVNTFD